MLVAVWSLVERGPFLAFVLAASEQLETAPGKVHTHKGHSSDDIVREDNNPEMALLLALLVRTQANREPGQLIPRPKMS